MDTGSAGRGDAAREGDATIRIELRRGWPVWAADGCTVLLRELATGLLK